MQLSARIGGFFISGIIIVALCCCTIFQEDKALRNLKGSSMQVAFSSSPRPSLRGGSSTSSSSSTSISSASVMNDDLIFRPIPESIESERPDPIVIYSYLRQDQSGWVIMDMLKAHSFAFKYGLIYGGACGESSHKKDIQDVLAAVGLDQILPLKCPGRNETNYEMRQGSTYEHGSGKRLSSLEWLDNVKGQMSYPIKDKNEFSIVVHIRRRDVTPCCYPGWYSPNVYFEKMIEKYVALGKKKTGGTKQVKVKIFSQSDSFESFEPFQNKSHYELNLDGPVGDVWKEILISDVFIGSKSEFSRVPSMFTRATHVISPRDVDREDPVIANQTNIALAEVSSQCTENMVLQCKNKWFLQHSQKNKKK